MPPLTSPLRELSNGVQFSVRVQPAARREAVLGPYGDALKIAIAAPAVDGRANEALIRFLAGLLDIPRSSVEIVSGQTSRTKLIRVLGITLAEAILRLTPPGEK